MPVVIACSACQGKMHVGEHLAGKAVKCPKCGNVVRTPAAVAKSPAPALGQNLVLTCPACQKKLSVRPELAGKAVKCPQCTKAVKVPGRALAPVPTPFTGDDWIEVNEAATPAEVAAAGKGPPTGDWGQALMEGHQVPGEMQEQIHAALRPNERLVWLERPQLDILKHQARLFQLKGVGFGSLVSVACAVGSIFLFKESVPAALAFWVFVVGFAVLAVYALGAPGRLLRTADHRACYVMTNRRLLIHPGSGTQTFHTSSGGAVTVLGKTEELGLGIYSGLQLTRMTRMESKRFPGAGDLLFGRSVMEDPAGPSLWALGNVREVEKLLREKLIHPIIDKLLRGETLSLADRPKDEPAGEPGQDTLITADANIKDYLGGSRPIPSVDDDRNVKKTPAAADDDDNLKSRDSTSLYNPKKVPAELREQVEEELTEGEQILWIGEPEGKTQGKGLFGKVTGLGATRVEPRYTLYGLTSRRALLWAEPGWQTSRSKSKRWGGDKQGPLSYYPTSLRGVGLEQDKRIKNNGGNVVFKQVKRTITSQDQHGKTKKTVQMYYFGFLRIRSFVAVAQRLYETLIAPCRGL
jgi:hypothetical protein